MGADATREVRLAHLHHSVQSTGLCTPPSEEKLLEDYQTFELLLKMDAEGWRVLMKGKTTDKEVLETPSDFIAGGKKIWWIKHLAKTFSHYYLLALLTAASHKRPVPHIKINKHYNALMLGKVLPEPRSYTYKRKGTSKKSSLTLMSMNCCGDIVIIIALVKHLAVFDKLRLWLCYHLRIS